MEKIQSILIDTLGSDKGPEEVLRGAKLLLDEFSNLHLVAVGDKNLIEKQDLDFSRVSIIDAPDTITNYDNAAEAFYSDKRVSIFKALEELATGKHIGLISSGNSGAVLVGSLRYLRTPEHTRPCMAAVMPNMKKSYTCMVDTGASVDVGPLQLHEFARLGRDFMRKLYKIENPRVGLLSNGSEPTKGNKVVKEAHKILAADESINFVGNIEANKALSGDCDVLVADGFAGNQVLKASEGMAVNLITDIVKYAKKSGDEEHIMPLVAHLMKTYNWNSLGAGIILGVKHPVLKCRGSSGAEAICSAGKILINLEEGKTFFEGRDGFRN